MGTATPAAEHDGTESRYLRWLKTGATWVVAAPFLLWGLLIVLGLPGALAVKVAEWTFDTGFLSLEIAVVVVLMAATVAALWWAFAHGGAISRLHLGRLEPTIRALAVTIFAVATFSALTALLYLEGGLEIRGGPIPADRIIGEASAVYVWHLVDTVPLLDVTSSLRWEPDFEFDDRVGGLLLLAFKGFVILPLIQVARLIFAGRRETYPVAVMTAIRRTSKDMRIRESPNADRMVVDDEGRLVRVDVMSEVWTEDAPVRRIRRLEHLDASQPFGYLLVVDGIADRARDRVEQALGEAPFAARLLVWRSDEPSAPVREELDRLRTEMALREEATLDHPPTVDAG
jgi:hypothetical protein